MSKNKYYNKSFFLKKTQNSHLMFVRAPKHFKAGKQHLVFFNGLFIDKFVLNTTNNNFFIYQNSGVIFNFLKKFSKKPSNNEILLHRITLKSNLKIFF